MPPIERIDTPIHEEQRRSGFRRLYAIEDAAWVWHPAWQGSADSVVRFENRFELPEATEFIFHLSADQRYELFLDGAFVAIGPDRSDVAHWSFKTYRVALAAGAHTLAVEAWWLRDPPTSQLTHRPGFILGAEGALALVLNTGTGRWTATDLSDAWTFGDHPYVTQKMVGKPQTVIGERWLDAGRAAVAPAVVYRPLPPAEWGGVRRGWHLRPSELKDQLTRRISTGTVLAVVPDGLDGDTPLMDSHFTSPDIPHYQKLVSGTEPVTVPPNTTVSVIWDLGQYYCGYSLADLGGGNGASVSMLWFEAAFVDPASKLSKWKGNRREWDGKFVRGLEDTFAAAAGRRHEYRSCWHRSGNYILVTVRTQSAPLTLHGLTIRESRYPLENEAAFTSDDPRLDRVLQMAERGVQMCAHETFVDCPHYEQIMYIGDTHLNMLTARVMSPDQRLIRRGIRLFAWSRHLHGMINSSYPAPAQRISTFPMYWLAMVHDHAYWADDEALIREMMPIVRDTIQQYRTYCGADGLLTAPPGWAFVDTVPAWSESVYAPPGDPSGIINLMFHYVLRQAADLERITGEPEFADFCERAADELLAGIRSQFWDSEACLFADTVSHDVFSEHAQVMALLSQALQPDEAAACFQAMLDKPDLARAQTFWQCYLFQAYAQFGRGDLILEAFEPWLEWLASGLRTPPEMYEPTRSDCHGWGGHPIYHLHASIAGVQPAAPGFRRVRVSPSLGPLKQAATRTPHPRGWISSRFCVEGDSLAAEIELPPGVTGELVYRSETRDLQPGLSTHAF